MKTLMPAELPGLPPEVLALVTDGIYSLYELPTDEPRYVLLVSHRTEHYFLSSCGDLMPPSSPVRSVAELPLGAPVMVRGEGGGIRMDVG